MTRLTVNGKAYAAQASPDTPLLWVLRDELGLTGTKFGCGIGQCGACTVHVEGVAVRACLEPLARLDGKAITTIEGLSEDASHPVQRAWAEAAVPQCGYCQGGQMMEAAALLRHNPHPSAEQITAALDGHLCRCGTYGRIRAAVRRAAELAGEST